MNPAAKYLGTGRSATYPGRFRITKHDLRGRPVFHWSDRRIRAHLAIAFMAYACVRHLVRRVALQKRPMSPRVIREALNDRQCSVLHDPETGCFFLEIG